VDRISSELIKLAESFVVHKAPVRVGLVLSVNAEPDVAGFDDPGVAMVLGFNAVASLKDQGKAISFLTDVCLL
jgi:UDP-glucose:glycoprotein glucosyltransferase